MLTWVYVSLRKAEKMVGQQKMNSYYLMMNMNRKNKKWQTWFLGLELLSSQTQSGRISQITGISHNSIRWYIFLSSLFSSARLLADVVVVTLLLCCLLQNLSMQHVMEKHICHTAVSRCYFPLTLSNPVIPFGWSNKSLSASLYWTCSMPSS